MTAFWNTDNPAKPKGVKDPDAIIDYPISFAAWLTDISDTCLSFDVLTTGGLIWDNVKSSQLNGIVTVWLSGGTVGSTATFTVRMVTVGGRSDDRTFYLNIQDR